MAKAAKARKQKKGTKARKPNKAPMKAARVMGPLSDPRVRAWDQLLRDPCAAPLAAPCYTGIDSGYLIRTIDTLSVGYTNGASQTIGATTRADVIVQVTPFNYASNTGVNVSASVAGGALGTVTASGFANNFINSSSVARYRPVAACVKWIPTGQYSVRQGIVASGYVPGMVFLSTGFSGNIGTIIAEVQRQAGNGAESHEVRWLPTAVDENFTNTAAAVNTGAGSLLFALRGVDATATSATAADLNGFFQITTVWEWVPAGTTGVTAAPQPPVPYTSQQVLGTIRDFGSYVYHGVRAASEVMQGAQGGMRLLTAGYGEIMRRGPSVPLIRY